jgi:hypothetical protein
MFNVPAKFSMPRPAARWFVSEVMREEVANDNMSFAEWVQMWEEVAASSRFEMVKDRARRMVAVARQANRPRAVR